MSTIPTITLNDGIVVPQIAFGTGTAFYQKDCSAAVLMVLNKGFRHLDLAEEYENAESTGQALRNWSGKREEVFIAYKCGNPRTEDAVNPPASLQRVLDQLGTSYVDLFLIQDPRPTYTRGRSLHEVWKDMEGLRQQGLCRSIGVSNFMAEHIEEIKEHWTIVPSVNQIEHHPYSAHEEKNIKTVEKCKELGITIMAYNALAPLFQSMDGPIDPVVNQIAQNKKATPGQVLLVWAAQNTGGIIDTTTRTESRMREIFDAFDQVHPLTEHELEAIAVAGKGRLYGRYTGNYK